MAAGSVQWRFCVHYLRLFMQRPTYNRGSMILAPFNLFKLFLKAKKPAISKRV